MKALQIIIEDCLKLNGIKTSTTNIKQLSEFLITSLNSYSVMYVKEQSIIIDKKSKKDSKNNLIVEDQKLSEYIESGTHEFPIVSFLIKELETVTDPLQISFVSDIPFSRIVNEQVDCDQWTESYTNLIQSIYEEIKPVLKHINSHGLLEEIVAEDAEYMKLIREFIKNELQ